MFKTPLQKIKLSLLLLVGALLVAVSLPATVVEARPAAQSGGGSLDGICEEDLGPSPSFDFEANTGHIQTGDGNSLLTWSYNLVGDPEGFQSPGPVLCVNQGATLVITLTNYLPVTTSIVFPGQTSVAASGGTAGLFTREASPSGGTVTYTLTDLAPGTYLYESGTEPHLQVHMGLYGALIVRPAGFPDRAYDDPSTAFSEEFLIMLHEVDPDLHQAVEREEVFDITERHDRYWFVNGRNFPDDTDDTGVPWFPYQPYGAFVTVTAVDPDDPNPELPVLIRYLNPGTVNHPFHPHGNHMQVIGRDGRRLLNYFENFNTTIGAGQTYDLLFQWRDVEGWENPANQIPATIPGLIPLLLNLVFKDDGSFYSGDPYLGDTGDFPAGTVVDNECGEFYFPWHSHALNEFQNFDEGFGGMATLVRVDPPGGCP